MNRISDYRRLSLLDLAARIVSHAYRDAIRDVCDRPLFRVRDQERLRLTEYLDRFRQGVLDRGLGPVDAHILENAYDLTLDKFTHFPEQDYERATPAGSRVDVNRRCGPDCRLTYRAFLEYATRGLDGVDGPLQRELGAARQLQGLVNRHFAWSCLERIRRGLTRRYAWQVNGHAVSLRMPSWMSAAECRTWLATHIGESDPSPPGGRARIQSVVDDLLGRPVVRRFSELGMHPETAVIDRISSCESILEDLANMGLAEAVAKEKAESIAAQRPAIRRLGKATLAEMVRRIFGDLAAGAYSDRVIAQAYGLSKATFSRFAGSRWRRPDGDRSQAGMPDLWKNTAQVLGSHPAFVEAARSSVWSSSGQLSEAGAAGDSSEAASADERRTPMSIELFFIPIIARALREPEVQAALRNAFTHIQQLGRSKSHERGVRQFERFLNAAIAWADGISAAESGPVAEWMTTLASGDTADGRFETLKDNTPDSTRGPEPLELTVFRDDREIGTIRVTGAGLGSRLGNITAGRYRITSRTGWTLWEGRLTAEQLRWSSAFPGRPYELAAATEKTGHVASLAEALLDGELVLRVFPGVECGQLTVEPGNA